MHAEPKKRGRPSAADLQAREGRRNAAEQGNEAESPVVAVVAPAVSVASLPEFIASIEGLRVADGVVLAHVSHPQAVGDVFDGRYSGIRTTQGPVSAKWSDGTDYQPDA